MATTDTDRASCGRCGRLLGPPPDDGGFHPPIMYVERLVPAYWGEDLCAECCQVVVTAYDLAGWPPLPDTHA